MALLIALLAGLLFIPLAEAGPQEQLHEVLYDLGNPKQSVGIIGKQVVEADDLYGKYRVLTFTPDSIVFKDLETGDGLKWIKEGFPDPKVSRHALHVFVVRQMKAIHQAQVEYFETFRSYAANLETLIVHGYLADGFKDGWKYSYRFSIAELGETERRAPHYEREPTFLAIAEPEEEGLYFFCVEQLGQVRYAASRTQVPWGPVWDYGHHGGVKSKYIGVD